MFNQAGSIRYEPERVVVEVDPIDTPRYQACVERLFEAINKEKLPMLDSERRLEFKVRPRAGATAEGVCHVL